MGLFTGVTDFFRGQFGGEDDAEKKRRKQREAQDAAQRQAAQKQVQAKPEVAPTQNVTQLFGAKKPELSQTKTAPVVNKPVVAPVVTAPKITQPAQPKPVVDPNQYNEIKQKALGYQKPKVQDVNNYYGNDLKVLQDELQKGDKADIHRVQGLMTSLDNRTKELKDFHKQRSENPSFATARNLEESVKGTRGNFNEENQKLKQFWDGASKNEINDFVSYLNEKGVRDPKDQRQAALQTLQAGGTWKNGTGANYTVDFTKDAEKVKTIQTRQQTADSITKDDTLFHMPLDQLNNLSVAANLENFKGMNPNQQRDKMHELEKFMTDNQDNISGNPELKRKYNQAAALHTVLDDSATQRSNFGTRISDIGAGSKQLGSVLLASPGHVIQSADALVNQEILNKGDRGTELTKLHEQGKLSDEDYNRQSNQYAQSLKWVPSKEKGFKGRLLTAAGTSADTVATLLPIGSLVKGGKAAWVTDTLVKAGVARGLSEVAAKAAARELMKKSLTEGGTKSLGRIIAEESAINATFSGAGSLRDGEFNPGQFLQEAAIGGVIGGAAPAIGSGATRVWSKLRGATTALPQAVEDIGRVTTRLGDTAAEDAATKATASEVERLSLNAKSKESILTTGEKLKLEELNAGTVEAPAPRPISDIEHKANIDQATVKVKEQTDRFIAENPSLTPEQVQAVQEAAQKRVDMLVTDLENNRAATNQAVIDQAKATDKTVADQQVVNQQVSADQSAQTAPIQDATTAPNDLPAASPELAANDGYGRSSNDFFTEQERRIQDAKENPLSRLVRLAREQIYDPMTMLKKYDTKGAVGNESIQSLVRRMTNPQQAIEMRQKAVIALPNGHSDSLWNIIQKYGKREGDKAKEFGNYRMFKDELWRMTDGGQEPSLRVDPQEMAAFVIRYEAQHPDAILDNAVLREFALRNLKERAAAGIDSQAILEASAKNPYYSPRTRATSDNKDLKMSHTGGFATTATSTSARTGADVAHSPLDLYSMDARNTEIGVIKQHLGENFYNRSQNGDNGFTTDVDPNTAVAHREAGKTFKDLRENLLQLRNLRNDLVTNKKLSKTELDAAAAKVKDLENQAIDKMRVALGKAANSPEDVLYDVAARDPQFSVEAAAIKAQKFPNLTPAERRAQISQDLTDLNAKYPDPNITTRKELLDLANSLDSGQFKAAYLADQATTLKGEMPDLADRLDVLKSQLGQTREDIGMAKDDASQAWADLQDTTQHKTDFSGNVWTFKVDGEAGRGTAPAELAAEYSKLMEFAKPGSQSNLLLKATQAVGSATKVTWTGVLAPVWQTLNIAKNFGLMLHNGKWLSAVSPSSMSGFVQGLVPIKASTREFISGLKSNGASYENLTQSAAMRSMVSDDIAARANIGTFLARNPVKTLKDLYHMTSAAFTHVANAQRNAVAYNAYKRAVSAGVPEERAMHMAVEEISNVFGDLQRVSELAQALEVVMPYSGATQAGVRALVNKAITSPAEFAVKQGAIIGGVTAFTLYSMGNSMDYYRDQIQRGFTTDLDNNFVIVLPGAKQDDKGIWSGIIKIPITPDFRALNKATWKSVYAHANGQGVDGKMVAGQLFNQFTGEMVPNAYNSKVAQTSGNPLMGIFAGSPALNTGKIIAGVNPGTGAPLSDSDMALRPRTEQANPSTSSAASNISNATGGALTPIQMDKIFGQLGNTGKTIKTMDDGTTLFDKFFNFKGAVTGSKGTTAKQEETRQHFNNVNAVEKSIDPTDKVTLKAFQAMNAKKTQMEKDNMLNSATKANQFMQYSGDGSFRTTKLFEAEKRLNDIEKSQGKAGNPMFDLPVQELQKVLMYRSLKSANAAGQNYSKGGESAFTSLGLDEKWYQDYRDAETAYYKTLPGAKDDGTRKSFSGQQKAEMSEPQKALQQQYFNMPAKSDARRGFLKANPWMKDFWAADNEFTDQERKALAFDSLNGDNIYDGKTDNGFGGGNGNYNPADHVNNFGKLTTFSQGINRLNPVEAAAMPQLAQMLSRLQGKGGSGRAKPRLGASASGR